MDLTFKPPTPDAVRYAALVEKEHLTVEEQVFVDSYYHTCRRCKQGYTPEDMVGSLCFRCVEDLQSSR